MDDSNGDPGPQDAWRFSERPEAAQPGWYLADPHDEDADTAVLRSLARLTHGVLGEFADHRQPDEALQAAIAAADLPTTRGVLIHALRRWHRLRARDRSV